jgi:hypothetical protein
MRQYEYGDETTSLAEVAQMRLHDADRVLGHSYYSEIETPRQPIEPVRFNRRDLIEIVVGVPVLGVLLFGIPFVLFLVAQP